MKNLRYYQCIHCNHIGIGINRPIVQCEKCGSYDMHLTHKTETSKSSVIIDGLILAVVFSIFYTLYQWLKHSFNP